jgi:hypothetical protein
VIFLLEELKEIAKRCNNLMVRRPEQQPPPPLASLLSGSLAVSDLTGAQRRSGNSSRRTKLPQVGWEL